MSKKGPNRPTPKALISTPSIVSPIILPDPVAEAKPRPDNLLFDFGQMCPSQSPTFHKLEEERELADAMERIKEIGKKTKEVAELERLLVIYGDFPLDSKLKHPKHVTRDAIWGRIRAGSRARIAGHIIGNVFYIVFFDLEHKFYPSDIQKRGKVRR